jgi:uncharacterized membrane protein
MSYQESRSLVNLISTLLINGLYAAYMLPRQPQGDAYSPEVFRFWGTFFLILIPVMIVAKIILFIVFHIINAIATRETEPPITDERDKLIELKATRARYLVFTLGFLIAMISLVGDMPPATMFMILVGSAVVAETVSDLTQFYFYRRGF